MCNKQQEKTPIRNIEIAHIIEIVALLVVIYQFWESNNMMRVQTRAAISDNLLTVSMGFSDKDMSEAFSKPIHELSSTQCNQLYGFSRGMFRTWENEYYQYKEGFFDDEEYEGTLKSWEQLLHWDKFRLFWNNQKNAYAKNFHDEMEIMIKKIEEKSSIKKLDNIKLPSKNNEISLCHPSPDK
ncbi:MAG: hypothetical protein V3U92_16625 [Cellulophaga sp.]